MRLSVTVLGIDLLTMELSTDDDTSKAPGDCTTQPISFVASPGDQRWEPGAEP